MTFHVLLKHPAESVNKKPNLDNRKAECDRKTRKEEVVGVTKID